LKALQLADLFWLKGDHRPLLALNWLVQCTLWLATTLFFHRLRRFTRQDMLALTGISAFFFFNPNQMQNFTWAFQVSFFAAFLFSTLAFICLCLYGRSDAPRTRKSAWLVLTIVCAFLAECSLASGPLTWLVLPVCAILIGLPRRVILLLAGCGVIAIGVYLIGYHSPENFSNPLESLRHPGTVLAFIGSYFGASWKFVIPEVGGLATLLAVIGLAYVVIKRVRIHERAEPFQAFAISVALMSIATAAVTALGRQSEGLVQAEAGRYQTPAMLFWWAIVLLLFFVATRKGELRIPSGALATLELAILAVFAIQAFHFPALLHSNINDAFARNGSGLALEANVDDLGQIRSIYPLPAAVPPTYTYAIQQALMKPPFREIEDVGHKLSNEFSVVPSSSCVGSIDSIRPLSTQDGKQEWYMTGWSYDLRHRAPFNRLLAATPDGLIVGIGVSGGLRPDVAKMLSRSGSMNSGWQLYAVTNAAPNALQVYGLVRGTNEVCQLPRANVVVPPVQPARAAGSLPSLESMRQTQTGSLDLLNGAPIPTDNNAQHPVRIGRSQRIDVQGWMITPDGQSAMNQVIVLYPGGRLVADLAARPDVAAHFNNQKLLSSGFRFDVAPNTLRPGLATFDVVGVSGGKFYRFAKTLFMFVE
jgi:hypothetical protein